MRRSWNRPPLPAREDGFTIAELLAALAVVAIVGTVATPIAASWRNHYAFTSASRQLAFEITRARMQAIGQNVFVRIRLDGTDRYVREKSQDGALFVADGASVKLPAGTSVLGLGGTPSFNRQGLANGDFWLVLMGYDTRAYAVLHGNVLGRVETSTVLW